MSSCTSVSVICRAWVSSGWMFDRPTTSRMALSATAFTDAVGVLHVEQVVAARR